VSPRAKFLGSMNVLCVTFTGDLMRVGDTASGAQSGFAKPRICCVIYNLERVLAWGQELGLWPLPAV
jgi:hypothetical protein